MEREMKKLLRESNDLLNASLYEDAWKLVQQVLKIDPFHLYAGELGTKLYPFLLEKNMRENIEGYEKIVKEELGEGWSEVQELWEDFAQEKLSRKELFNLAYEKKYTITSSKEFSLAIQKAQKIFVEEKKES